MSELGVGQAVVTDPEAVTTAQGGDGAGGAPARSAGGYVLVGASPGMASQDLDFIELYPGITEHLHRTASPGPFITFLELPSGRKGLIRRFVSGTRRGVNRVVVHLLSVPAEALAASNHDPWLLVSHARYRGPDSQELSLVELGRRAAAPASDRLPDLVVVPPEDTAAASQQMLQRRRDFLLEQWGERDLVATLAWVLDRLAQGQDVLLPQGRPFEELTVLVASMLPRSDRTDVAWTTHLGSRVRTRFRIANDPDPERTARLGATGAWQLLPWPPLPVSADERRQRTGAVSLSCALVSGRPSWQQLCAGAEQHHLSLLEGGGQLLRWVSHLDRHAASIREGFASPAELHAYLEEAGEGWTAQARDPWLAEVDLLHCVCTTGRRVLLDAPAAVIAAELRSAAIPAAWRQTLLRAEVVEELATGPLREGTSSGHLALLGAELVRQEAAAAAPPAVEQLESMLSWFAAARQRRMLGSGDDEAAAVLANLAADLARHDPATGTEALELLATAPGGLRHARDLVRLDAEDLPLMVAILETSLARDDSEQAAELVERALIPLLAAEPELEVEGDLLATALATLHTRPHGLAAALATWSGTTLETAVAELERWCSVAPPAARAVARSMDPDALPRLAAADGTIGLSAALADCGVPVQSWTGFAVAEAMAVERTGPEQHPVELARVIAAARPGAPEAAMVTAAALEAVGGLAAGGQVGEGCRVLYTLAEHGMAELPEQTALTLGAVLETGSDRLVHWAPQAGRTMENLASHGATEAADQLCRQWWCAIARTDWKQLPATIITTLDRAGDRSAEEILRAWVGHIPCLSRTTAQRHLRDGLARLARRVPRSVLTFTVEAAVLAAAVHAGEADLVSAVNHVDRLAATIAGTAPALPQALRDVLPAPAAERARTVVELLLDPRVGQSVKLVLERNLLRRALREAALERPLEWLPPAENLAARKPLLTAVMEHLGGSWDHDPDLASGFLTACLRRNLLFEAEAFLYNARGRVADGEDYLTHLVTCERSDMTKTIRHSAQRGLGRMLLTSHVRCLDRLEATG